METSRGSVGISMHFRYTTRFSSCIPIVGLILCSILLSAEGLVSYQPQLSCRGACARHPGGGTFQGRFATYLFSTRQNKRVSSDPTTNSDEIDFPEPEVDDEMNGDDNDGDQEAEFVGLDSPLSQLPPEDFSSESPLQLFARNEKWLEAATEDMLDPDQFPLGELTEEHVETITGLMTAWVRRRSVPASLNVERLLKRVVDDMRANNKDIQVTTKMYTIAIDAWAKSGADGSAQRAQHIHDTLVQMYQQTGDPAIKPSTISYNTLLNAHGKSSVRNALDNAEKVLQEMIDANDDDIKPDAVTFSTLMDAYGKTGNRRATARVEELFEMMDDLKVKRNVYTYSSLQNVHARSGLPDAPQRAEAVLYQMLDLYNKGDVFAKPNCVNYNALLNALSRSPNTTHAETAYGIINKMELPVSEGGFDVEPDRLSYALAILTCARCPDDTFGVDKAIEILEKMEARALLDERKRQEVSSAAPPSVRLDVECFNVVLTALSKSRSKDAVDRIIAIIQRMEKYAEEGQGHVMPTARSWNAVLNAMARSRDKEAGLRAEQVLSHMYDLYKSGVPKVKPDAFSFAAVLGAYQKSPDPDSVQRADDILRRMEELYECGEIEAPPDVYHYTIVCAAWAKSQNHIAPRRAMQILAHMKELDAQGYPDVKPNVRTYNAGKYVQY
jgi:hypothetical protein